MHLGAMQRSRLDRNDELVGVLLIAFMPNQPSVDAFVRTLLLLPPRPDLPQRPPLELVGVALREDLRVVKRRGLADHLDRDCPAERCLETMPDEADSEMCDVYADPPSFEALRHGNRRPAAAERIEHEIALVAACLDNPLEQPLRLLRGIPEALLRRRHDRLYFPDVIGVLA